MFKRGSKYLGWAILQAARLVAMRTPVFKDYLSIKMAEGKHYNVAIPHTAKKLLRVIFAMLTQDQKFC